MERSRDVCPVELRESSFGLSGEMWNLERDERINLYAKFFGYSIDLQILKEVI